MAPDELRHTQHQKPFEPFRIVLSDGTTYDIRHPDLLWVGQRSAYVGLTGQPADTFFERSIKLDLLHVTQIIPLEPHSPPSANGPPAS